MGMARHDSVHTIPTGPIDGERPSPTRTIVRANTGYRAVVRTCCHAGGHRLCAVRLEFVASGGVVCGGYVDGHGHKS